ncbi:Hypothetical protein BRZCDTV_334 [Brazilian cedratvirus IHUMI]|uniref:Uncharacterized protein n=1 Tax=Brazilian cedratvirus IHUMI TaxID=2126980 RepID=A0A2R8FEK5_9VIRU|nr:Hypothetical protein BRZCDTV_334 [Brazilian cedratvirus IHUMI]
MAKSLYSTVLHNYTYEQVRDLCFASDSTFGNVFDCDWGVWRDKAVVDFGVSPQFFDLVPNLSGPQRYLQIASYVKLTPLSGVRVYEDGTIEGVYEAWKGYTQARLRKDPDMLLWFANRIKPEQQTGPRRNISQKTQSAIDDFAQPKEKKQFIFRYEDLLWFVKHGKIRELDEIIHNYFTLPEGFSIEKDVPYVPFWEITDKYSALLDLPLQDYSGDIEDLVNALASSGDVRIVDFFRSIFRDRLDLLESRYASAQKSLLLHGKPEETFGIEVRFFNPEKYIEYQYMAETLLGISVPNKEKLKSYVLTSSLGDITYLMAVLPLFSKEVILEALKKVDGLVYPLSKAILENYI